MAEPEAPYIKSIVSPLLTYVASSTLHSTAQDMKAACKSFYTLKEVVDAKDLLWEVGDADILGQNIKRQDSHKGNKLDKVLDDVVVGINKLSVANKLPVFTVDIHGLSRIPKAAPHEALPISICERMNALEEKMSALMNLVNAPSKEAPGPQVRSHAELPKAARPKQSSAPREHHRLSASLAVNNSQKDPQEDTVPSMAKVASQLKEGDFVTVHKKR